MIRTTSVPFRRSDNQEPTTRTTVMLTIKTYNPAQLSPGNIAFAVSRSSNRCHYSQFSINPFHLVHLSCATCGRNQASAPQEIAADTLRHALLFTSVLCVRHPLPLSPSHRLSTKSVLFPTSTMMTSAPRSVLTSSIHLAVLWKLWRPASADGKAHAIVPTKHVGGDIWQADREDTCSMSAKPREGR